MSDDASTLVMPEQAQPAPKPVPKAALALLAFGSVPSSVAGHSFGPKHLAFLPPDALELDLDDPGQRQFGDYELIGKLGQGGMGVVYRARQVSLDRDVALKLLSAGPWASADFIERFRREAQSAARMQHPNIVAIYEIGAHDELNFFSMRLVQGVSLAHLLQESGPLPPKRAAQLMRTIAEALDYAHRLGVLHLDLKPANVLIDERGEPQVADFGLARRLDETLTTDSDEISGTPSYMAPEQAQIKSHKLSQATDIYGLGAILYELITGQPPFLGATAQDTLQRVISEQPTAPRALQSAIPVDLEAICLKCLAKEPGERYPSARALGDDLARFLDGRQVSVRPLNALQRTVRWARREPRFAGAVAFALLAVITGLVVAASQWRRAELNAETARATAWSQRLDAMSQNYERGEWVAALPRIVQNLREQEDAGATRQAEAERRRLGILFAASPRLIDVIPVGTPVATLAISRDATRIVAVARDPRAASDVFEVHMFDAVQGTRLWHKRVETQIEVARFSPDGRTLMVEPFPWGDFYFRRDNNRSVRLDAATGEMIPHPPELEQAPYVLFNIDASIALAVVDGRLRTFRTDTWSGLGLDRPFQPGGRVRLSADGGTVAYAAQRRFEFFSVAGQGTGSYEAPDGQVVSEMVLAPDGGSLALTADSNRIVLIDTREGKVRFSDAQCAGAYYAAFSPDSAWMTGTCSDQRTRIWDARDGRPLSNPIQHRDYPQFVAADAAHRIVLAHENGRPRIYRIPPDSGARFDTISATPMLNSDDSDLSPWAGAFNPAHSLLAFGTLDGRIKLWRLPRPPLLPAQAAPLMEPDLVFDGRHVVTVEGTAARVIAAFGDDAGPALRHAEPVLRAFLTPDGARAVTTSGREIRVWDWRAGVSSEPLVLDNSPARVLPSPDGRRLLTSVTEARGGRSHERLQLWRLEDRALLGESLLPGPLFGVRYSADGGRVLAWRGGKLVVLDGARLGDPLFAVRTSDDIGPVWITDAHTPDGGEVHATTRRRNANYLAYYWRWDGRTGTLREKLPLTGMAHRFDVSPQGALAMSAADATPRQSQRSQPGASLEFLPLLGTTQFSPVAAYAGDGRWLAQAPRSGALLVDADTRIALSPSLLASLSSSDRVDQLAFDGRGDALLARTELGRWLAWDVAPDQRPLEEIEREHQLYAPTRKADWSEPVSTIDPEVRSMLRGRDPGVDPAAARPQAPEPRKSSISRAPDTPEALLDLGRHFTPLPTSEGDMLDIQSVPFGRQRLLGIDFDVRGVVLLAGPDAFASLQSFPKRVDGIALPRLSSRLAVLMSDLAFGAETHVVLETVLRYRDGGERRQQHGFRVDPIGFDTAVDDAGDDESSRGAKVAWLARWRGNTFRLQPPLPIFLVEVGNPEPQRELASLTLIARSAPYILAITAQPPTDAAKPPTP